MTSGADVSRDPALGQFHPVLVRDDGPIRVITLNRPNARNAIDLATATAIETAIDEYEARADLWVAVLAAEGPVFSAGMDLKAFLRGERPSTERRGFAGLVERPPAKPLIAAVDGPAVAGGFEIVLACDIIVASTASSFALPEVKRGLVAAGGGLLRLPQRIPFHRALALALTGATIDGAEAHVVGLVNSLTQPGDALAEALRLAGVVVANGPLAVRATKRVVYEAATWPPDEAFDRQREISEPVRSSEDAREGARSFVERRPARWRGR